jgi:hypothetical protein
MRFTKTVPLAVAAVLVLPGAALAKDRNHDGLPDGWEKAHNLSLRVNQAHRDQDNDGLDNRAEFRHRTNPRRANTKFVGQASQDNGNAGTVTSFANGVLTITLNDGSTLKGAVTPQTEVACENSQTQAGDDDQNEDRGDDHGGDRAKIADDNGDRNDQGDANNQQGDNEQGDDDQPAGQPSTCTIAQGDPVREADLKATSSGAVFEEVKLAK